MIRIFYLFLFPLFLCANYFESRLENASVGDFIVMEQNKILSLITLQKKTDTVLWIEQISVPSSKQKNISSWKSWVQKKAPGHTSWIRYEVDLESKKIIECFSYSQSAWLQFKDNQSMLSQLLTLDLFKLPEQHRKKVGYPPPSHEKDTRPFWQPYMIFEGEIQTVSAEPFTAQWPKDGSPLSGKHLELFFDIEEKIAFPYWMLIHTKDHTYTVHIRDCGKNLNSPYKKFPRRPPEFKQHIFNEDTLTLHIQCPLYYKDFYLYARDLNDLFQKPKRMSFFLKRDKENLQLQLNAKNLSKLQKEHHYQWLLIPKDHPSIHAESKNSFYFAN